MNLDRQIHRVFGLEKSSGFRLKPPPAEEETTLAHVGYPLLRQVDWFLPVPKFERWRADHTISFPAACCVCSRKPEHDLSSYIYPRWLGTLRRKEILTRVPHCGNHGRGDEAQLLALVTSWSEWVCQVALIGLNEHFLSETRELNQRGDMPPPWRAFPGYEPDSSGWRQGNGEFWLLRAWSPFWAQLSELERQQYILRWDASSGWRSWLSHLT